jgi:hypothetical protein
MKTITRTVKALLKDFSAITMLTAISMMSFSTYAQNTFPSSGSVGIGTTAPSERLHVTGGAAKIGFSSSQADRDISMLKIGDGSYIKIGEWEQDDRLTFYARNGYNFSGGKVGIGVIPSATNTLQVSGTLGISPVNINPGGPVGVGGATLAIGPFKMYTILSGAGNFRIGYNDKDLMYFAANGNVGIGSFSSPENTAHKLSVAGSIRAQEIVCETGWADFVFEENYKLRDLSEVENYIKENKHLPEIPSAKEIEANGVRMAEMEAKLLQKIEELTLYAIKANKEIESLKVTVAEMQGNKNK